MLKVQQKEEERDILTARISLNQMQLHQIQRYQKRYERIYSEYQDIAELYRLASGNNGQKLSFERYVLGGYFADIIKAANHRLYRMTDGRFTLVHKKERAKFGASGLDLDIIDSFTGKERDISTLSGGEAFKASLSLALGLSDIIQAYAGAVEMNTMFIDEGFGTLDMASLQTAIDTLYTLSSHGRTIGIISHVNSLKETIPARITVHSSPTGSSVSVHVKGDPSIEKEEV